MKKIFSRILSTLITSTLLLSLVTEITASASGNFTENFNGTVSNLTGYGSIVDEDDGNGKMLKVGNNALATYSFDAISEGTAMLSYSIKPGEGLDTLLFLKNSDETESYVATFFTKPNESKNNDTYLITGTSNRNTTSETQLMKTNPTYDVWYDVKLYINFTTGKITTRVLQDGNLIGSLENSFSLSNIGKITLQVWNKNDTKASYLDDFAVATSGNIAGEGMNFIQEAYYYPKTGMDTFPATYEATVYIPSTITNPSGVIWSNYGEDSDWLRFEINENLYPVLYIRYKNEAGELVYPIYEFSNKPVPTDQWVHITIVRDFANKICRCYYNGEWADTMSSASDSWLWSVSPENLNLNTRFILGGDWRQKNTQYFKGQIGMLALYSDVRDEAEIKEDYLWGGASADNLLLHYDLMGIGDSMPEVIEDLSTNEYDLYLYPEWVTNKEPVTDYAYSMAIVGDTQNITCYEPMKLAYIYDWITENAEAKNIKWVFGLGDITDKNSDDEWRLARACIKTLDNVVPYSIIRGNHDAQDKFKKFFPYSDYENRISGSFDGTMLNTYQKFHVGDVKYMVLNLDFGPHDDVLEWANDVVSKNPDYNVIVTTHAYLDKDAEPLEAGDEASPTSYGGEYYSLSNNGDDMWNEFISKHANISLVLSGHIIYPDIVKTEKTGVNSNNVIQMLVNPQGVDLSIGAAGLVAMLYFSEDGKMVDVEYYSTVQKKYYSNVSQFQMELDTVEVSEDAETIKEISSISGISFDVTLEGDVIEGTIYAALYSKEGTLTAIKTYPANEKVNVSFDDSQMGDHVKVMWWQGDKLIPVCESTMPISAISE